MPQGTEEPVVDFGAHFHTTTFPQFESVHEELGARARDPDAYAAWFESSGIDHAVLSQTYFLGYRDSDRTAEANDALLEVIEETDAFYGLAAIPVAAGETEAAAEFQRSLDNGYNGGALVREADGIGLTDPELEPVFEVADETGAPILVHPTTNESIRSDVLDNTHQNNLVFGREAALCASINDVVHSDLLERYPNLTLVYHHLGGNFASMFGRLRLRFDVPWSDLGDEVTYEQFKHRLENRIYVDTSGYYSYGSPLRATLEEFPSSQVLFGTDAPYEPRSQEHLRTYVETIEGASSDRDSRRILGGNAMDLLVNV